MDLQRAKLLTLICVGNSFSKIKQVKRSFADQQEKKKMKKLRMMDEGVGVRVRRKLKDVLSFIHLWSGAKDASLID